MAFLAFRVTFLASNRNILFQSCFCKAFFGAVAKRTCASCGRRSGGAGVERMPGERVRHGNGAGQVVCSQWGVRLLRGDWVFPVAAKQGTGLCPDSFCAADKARGPFVPTAVLDGGVPRAENGGMRCGVLDCTFREVLEYCAASTRVLSAKYSGVLQAAWLRAAGGAPAE